MKQALRNVFPTWDAAQFSEGLPLGHLPGWDSMNSVNLQVELEDAFGITLGNSFLLHDKMTLGELMTQIAALQRPGKP